jgi:hypothetical protein
MDLPAKLKENEYLLKVRPASEGSTNPPTGFLAKYTQKGELQKSFDEWGIYYYWNYPHGVKPEALPITLHVEDFKSGWKLFGWRYGKSQNWAEMIHPNGFILEIYLTNFLDIVKETVVINGELGGEYKWERNKLIKKEL